MNMNWYLYQYIYIKKSALYIEEGKGRRNWYIDIKISKTTNIIKTKKGRKHRDEYLYIFFIKVDCIICIFIHMIFGHGWHDWIYCLTWNKSLMMVNKRWMSCRSVHIALSISILRKEWPAETELGFYSPAWHSNNC